MDYDLILEHLGEWGTWSWVHQLLIWCGPFISGFTSLVYSFTGEGLLQALFDTIVGNYGKHCRS